MFDACDGRKEIKHSLFIPRLGRLLWRIGPKGVVSVGFRRWRHSSQQSRQYDPQPATDLLGLDSAGGLTGVDRQLKRAPRTRELRNVDGPVTPVYRLTGASPSSPNEAAVGDGTATRIEQVWPGSGASAAWAIIATANVARSTASTQARDATRPWLPLPQEGASNAGVSTHHPSQKGSVVSCGQQEVLRATSVQAVVCAIRGHAPERHDLWTLGNQRRERLGRQRPRAGRSAGSSRLAGTITLTDTRTRSPTADRREAADVRLSPAYGIGGTRVVTPR